MRAHYDENDLPHPEEFWPPDLPDGADIFVKALQVLSPDRPLSIGFGVAAVGQIPFTTIAVFADRNGVGKNEFDRFVRVLRRVDAAIVAELNKKK